ncbi:O-antigen ligase [uncultured Vibrio sp.]|uniref:O-antigen ligase family protein n=1 Tax=uncultured Vibrio sp. TaxID=114054 RepID=UPI0025D7E100|nr:O-antigen ligase family protein [uncultured Vibrio sp.]
MNVKKSSILQLFFIMSILFFSRSFTFLLVKEEGIGSSAIFQLFSLLIYVLSFAIILKRVPIYYVIKESKWILLFISLMFASSVWSDLPGKTFSRSVAMLGTVLFSYSLYICYSAKEATRLIIIPLGVGAFLSLFLALFLPTLGVHGSESNAAHIGLWKGVYGFKNHLGRFMVILVLALIATSLNNRKIKHSELILVLVAIFCTIKSGSSTALFLLAVCPAIIFAIYTFTSEKFSIFFKMSTFAILIFMSILVVLITPWIVTEIFNKDMTGSGRTLLWDSLFNASQNPYFGHGFGGVFWGEFSSAFFLMDEYYYMLGHAHNGFVDIWLELGYFGVFIFIALLMKMLYTGKIVFSSSFFSENTFFFVVIIFLILYSISGGGFVKQNNLMWVLFCMSWFYLHSERNKQ